MSSRCIAVIPARGGSKGVPRKNVLDVGGLPLVAHTILAAQASRHVQRVLVSTDDDEIAEVCARFGVEVVVRPPELSGDQASSESALLHALSTLEAPLPELLVFLQCTSPLTEPDHIDGAVDALLTADADSALCVAPFHGFLWKDSPHREAMPVLHDKSTRPRRQDREPQYLETGSVYVMRVAGFLEVKHRFFGRTVMHVIPSSSVLEIDSPEDMERARRIMPMFHAKAHGQGPLTVGAIVMDFDGVFTDNRVWVNSEGIESVACSRSDGMGLEAIRRLGIPMLVLSKERNPVVKRRCDKLGIPCVQALDDKKTALSEWLAKQGVEARDAMYVGNDINDLGCMSLVGHKVAVGDAHPSVKRRATVVLRAFGGMGALREVAELLCPELRGDT